MITVSIVLYRSDPDEVARIISCVDKSSVARIFIVDNSPNDSLKELAGSISGKVEYIHGHGNVGYGAAHNIAIRRAMQSGATYHVVLNPDVYFKPGTLETIGEYMDQNPDVGQIMPKILYPNGEIQYVCKLIPTPFDLIFKRFLPSFMTRRRMNRFQFKFTGYDSTMNVPYLSGSFMFFRTEALREVGLFDERFFMYPEDIDITRRMHERYRTLFYPGAIAIHAHAAASRTNMNMLKIHIINLIRYFNKWGWIWDAKRKKYNRNVLIEWRRNG